MKNILTRKYLEQLFFRVQISHLQVIYSAFFILTWKLEAANSRIAKGSAEHESQRVLDDCKCL